ncbi:MAG: HAD family phosphatase [Ruminococcaceae bacterium]|nr:HAD family phosphatase [Oscillospiraceae bacterium]
MNTKDIKLIAFDLDGTLTQHKSKLSAENRKVLQKLSEKYKLLMVGAGTCRRIFEQMDHFPIDIIGNYGMQYAKYNKETGDIETVRDEAKEVDREKTEKLVTMFREKYGFTNFSGNNVEYHPSGCITFPILGTAADIADKLAFDPDRKKRRAIYDEVKAHFPDYVVFVGGSSSFDMAPKPYDKAYALSLYCTEHGIKHSQVVYVGDDYGRGGNDESVFLADYNFVKIDDYTTLPEKLAFLL